MWWIYPSYIALAAAIIFLSYKLGDYVDLLDKKTKISGAFIGGILLAAVTSLPELFTSISAVAFLKKTDMVVGNILGSNLFNFMVLGLSITIFFFKFKKAKVDKSHIFSLTILLGQTICALCAFIFPKYTSVGPINLLTIVILALYILNLFIQPKSSDDKEKEDESNKKDITIKQIIFRFIICAVLLVTASIFITLVTDLLAAELNLSANIAGSLFLAIATSLPEVVSTLTLCKRGNFNAGYGNIIGSGIFNCVILVVAELFSWKNSVFVNIDSASFITESFLMAICGISVALITIATTLGLFLFQKKERSKTSNVAFSVASIILGVTILSGYLVFLFINSSGVVITF
jgi:cation:H+ antiporter